MNAFSSQGLAANLGEDFGATTSAVLLWALKSAYTHLEDCIAEMERVTGARELDMSTLANARFRISQASYARRQLVRRACDHLSGHATAPEADVIQSIRSDAAAYVRSSTEHVRNWRPSEIARDWAGYRRASRDIRAKLKVTMRTEQRLLFPLLAHYEHI